MPRYHRRGVMRTLSRPLILIEFVIFHVRCSCMTRYSSPSAPLHFEAERSAKQLAASGSVVRSPAGTSSSTGVPCGDDDECSPAQPLPSRSAVSSSVVDPEAMSLEQYCDALST